MSRCSREKEPAALGNRSKSGGSAEALLVGMPFVGGSDSNGSGCRVGQSPCRPGVDVFRFSLLDWSRIVKYYFILFFF